MRRAEVRQVWDRVGILAARQEWKLRQNRYETDRSKTGIYETGARQG